MTYGFHPRSPHSQEVEFMLAGDSAGRSPAAFEFVATMDRNFIIAKKCLARAQDKMKKAREGKQAELILQKDQLVLLRTTNLTMPGKRKFLPRFVGPFSVIKAIGVNAYQIQLPEDWKIHNVFNVSLLKAYEAREGFRPSPARPPDDDHSYIPSCIVEHEVIANTDNAEHPQYKYRVHYADTSNEDDTWEFNTELLQHCFDMLQAYHEQNDLYELTQPNPPRPEPVRVTSIRRASGGSACAP
jgi:hypothetical protein